MRINWDGSRGSEECDCQQVYVRDHGRGEKLIAPHRWQPSPGTRNPPLRRGGEEGAFPGAGGRSGGEAGMVRLQSKHLFSPFQCQAQNKAKLISETRRRFEAEYVTGGYRVLGVEADVY